jgi:hypothetical protein
VSAVRLPAVHNGKLVFAIDPKLFSDEKKLVAAIKEAHAMFEKDLPAQALEKEADEHLAKAVELREKAIALRTPHAEEEDDEVFNAHAFDQGKYKEG